MVYKVTSIDAALFAAKEKEKRAERRAFGTKGLMLAFQKQNRAANERMMSAQKADADAYELIFVTRGMMRQSHDDF